MGEGVGEGDGGVVDRVAVLEGFLRIVIKALSPKDMLTLVTFRIDMSVLSFFFRKFRNSSADFTPRRISSKITRGSVGS